MRRILTLLTVVLVLCALCVPVFAAEGESGGYVGTLILIGCIGGFAAALGTAIGIVYSYKRKSRSPQYPLERYASLNLTNRMDIFLRRHVTRTKMSSSNNKK